MQTVLKLDGQWELTGQSPAGESLQLSAQVPGQVHLDLEREGKIEDPFWRDNAEKCQWVEQWDWTYQRSFELPADFVASASRFVLVFEGLDTFATITLNGAEVGKTKNMFIEHRFEVGSLLKSGQNTLKVEFMSIPKALEGKDLGRYFACFSTADRSYIRRMQCTFGWDWVHRFVSYGIWQPCSLVALDAVELEAPYVFTRDIQADTAQLHVECELNTAEDSNSRADQVMVAICDPQGNLVCEQALAIDADKAGGELEIANPQLWWPIDMGGQPLYEARFTALDAEGNTLGSTSTRFGIRTTEFEEIPDAEGPGSSFTLLINGERMFLKGGNWVPSDPFPARIDEARHRRLLEMAAAAHCNFMRHWGGGIYESEAFWNICDELGIMISQDFMLACAQYPEDEPEFLEELRIECNAIIRRLRNHPSLAYWCGDNELGMGEDEDSAFNGRVMADEVSGPACAALDPSRPYRKTNPYGGNPNNCHYKGDTHASVWYDQFELMDGDMSDYQQRVDALSPRMLTETTTAGAPSWTSLMKFMTPEDAAAPDRAMWELHTKDNPYNTIKHLTHFDMLEQTALKLLGKANDTEEWVWQLGYMHYEWNRLMIESMRRKMYHTSGILFWMFNDCWPASGWAAVDYYGYGKPGYYALKSRYKPVIASIRHDHESGKIEVYVCNERLTPLKGELRLLSTLWQGAPRWEQTVSIDMSANSAACVLSLSAKECLLPSAAEGAMVAILSDGNEELDRAFYHLGNPCEMDLPVATLNVEEEASARSGKLTITTDHYARCVKLEADLDFSANYFDLLPGQTRIITWTSPVDFTGAIDVRCFNGQLVGVRA